MPSGDRSSSTNFTMSPRRKPWSGISQLNAASEYSGRFIFYFVWQIASGAPVCDRLCVFDLRLMLIVSLVLSIADFIMC